MCATCRVVNIYFGRLFSLSASRLPPSIPPPLAFLSRGRIRPTGIVQRTTSSILIVLVYTIDHFNKEYQNTPSTVNSSLLQISQQTVGQGKASSGQSKASNRSFHTKTY